jgi:hypothetical protein
MSSRFHGLTFGAEWRKCALQVNPYSYLVENNCVPLGITDEATYNAGIVQALTAEKIDLVAITDHWCVDSGIELKGDIEAAGITVFPGFEATSKDGVHLLMLFDPGAPVADINRYIGSCGIPSDCRSSIPGELDAETMIGRADAWGAVVIAPHATTGGGLLHKLTGQTAIRVWRNPRLHAIAPGGTTLTQAHAGILDNTDNAYKRDNPVAVISAADVRNAADLSKPGTVCWIKLSSLSVLGLDLAFRTPETRVSRVDPTGTVHSRIVGISWEGGFLDGVNIPLNESLNVLIGGRGTGKSTVIESVRFALGIDPLATTSQIDHDAMVKEVLRAGTKVHIEVQTRSPTVATFTIERLVGHAPTVRDATTGGTLTSAPTDIIAGVEVYGQRELAELARNKQQLTELLARYLPEFDPKAGEAETKALVESRAEIVKAQEHLEDLEESIARIPVVKERLKGFEDAGVAKRLEQQAATEEERSLLERAGGGLGSEWDPADDLVDLDFLADQAIADLPDRDLLLEARDALANYNVAVGKAFAHVEAARGVAVEALETTNQKWSVATAAIREALEKLLRELQPDGIDGGEYLRLRHELTELEPLTKEAKAARGHLTALRQARSELLIDVFDARAARLRAIEKEAKKVRKLLPGVVQATVRAGEDRSSITQVLDQHIGGRLDTVRNAVSAAPSMTGPGLADLCRLGKAAIAKAFPSVSDAQATLLANASEDTLMALEEVQLPVSTDLQLNVGSKNDPVWRSLDHLSTGQKATALLLLLMERGSGPLLIDQPEDDLDNSFIFADVVPRLRRKGRRQVIFSSHNANIPVLGDADQIVALVTEEGGDGVLGTIAADGLGSIDHEPVRQMVEEVLEGGREAFVTRRYLYGF